MIHPNDEVFLDTSYAIALASPTDQFHDRALALAQELESSHAKLVTTRAVLLEIGNALSRRRYRTAAAALLRSLEADKIVEILSLNDDLFHRAVDLFCSRPDKEWGLIDCVSFTAMTDRDINSALTADEHFRQSGFRVLLRE